MAQKPLLTLDTLESPERPAIEVDKVAYPMRVPGDFGLRDEARIRTRGKRADVLYEKGELTEAEASELATILDELAGEVLPDLPAEKRAKLKDIQKVAILRAFGAEAARRRASLLGTPPAEEGTAPAAS